MLAVATTQRLMVILIDGVVVFVALGPSNMQMETLGRKTYAARARRLASY